MSIPKVIHYCWFGKGEMPKGKTTVIIHSDDEGRLTVKRDGESPLSVMSEGGEGSIKIGYCGYFLSGSVSDVSCCVLNCSGKSICAVEIKYLMDIGGSVNNIVQKLEVISSEE